MPASAAPGDSENNFAAHSGMPAPEECAAAASACSLPPAALHVRMTAATATYTTAPASASTDYTPSPSASPQQGTEEESWEEGGDDGEYDNTDAQFSPGSEGEEEQEEQEGEEGQRAQRTSADDEDGMSAEYEGEEYEEGGAISGFMGGWAMPPRRFCTNCTQQLLFSDECSACGHSAADDDDLFDSGAAGGDAVDDAALRTAIGAAAAAGAPLLCYDERMLLHDEGRSHPHPERPDRLRAIMARLSRSGLSGVCVW